MGRFNIVAINSKVYFTVFLGLLALVMGSLFILADNRYISVFSVLAVLVPALLFYFYMKRYFSYRLTLELFGDRFTVTKEEEELEVLFSDVDYYKVETMNGILLQIRLKNRKWIKIESTGAFGSEPEVLEEFTGRLEERLKVYERESSVQVRRKKTFSESKAGFLFALIAVVIGAGALVLGLLTGKATVTSISSVLVAIFLAMSMLLVKRRD